jgi:hypothetical protein
VHERQRVHNRHVVYPVHLIERQKKGIKLTVRPMPGDLAPGLEAHAGVTKGNRS